MSKRKMVSIVLYGEVSSDKQEWVKWYKYSVKQIFEIGFTPNYAGIVGPSFKSGKIMTLDTTENKLKKDVNVESLSIYALQKDFKQAAFDYDVLLARTSGEYPHIILTVLTETFSKININKIVDKLKNYIKFNSGQIFEMYNYESPQFYAAKVNSPKSYKSLNIIKELTEHN